MRHIWTITVLALFALAALGGYALALAPVTITLDSIENSPYVDIGPPTQALACQVTARTGIGNVVVDIQGSLAPSDTDDKMWGFITNSLILNATAAATDSSSWAFQNSAWWFGAVRGRCLTGCGATNTVTIKCFAGGR